MTALTDEVNREFVDSCVKHRPRAKTEAFDQLVRDLNGDVLMAEMMWIYWGKGALKAMDAEMPALNPHLRWWRLWQKRNTIRSLVRDPNGKQWVWQMLHDASAWLL